MGIGLSGKGIGLGLSALRARSEGWDIWEWAVNKIIACGKIKRGV
jgi:hypothetical protein